MDKYLPVSILQDIYCYLGWNELRHMKDIHDNMWERMCDRYCGDEHFKSGFKKYWDIEGKVPLSHKILFLSFINHLVYMVKRNFESIVPAMMWRDKDFVVIASKYSNNIIKYIPQSFLLDRDFIMSYLTLYPSAIEYMNETIKLDRKIALEVVNKSGVALYYLHEKLKQDREIVLAAIRKNGMALEYAHSSFYSDREIVFEASKNKAAAFKFASPDLRADVSFVRELIKYKGSVLKYVDDIIFDYWDILLTAAKQNPEVLRYIPAYLIEEDYDFICEAAKIIGEDIIGYINLDLLADNAFRIRFEKCVSSCKNDPWVLD